MPNKHRKSKLKDKLLLSGANLKQEHIKTTLKQLIEKSKIEEGSDLEEEYDKNGHNVDIINDKDKVEVVKHEVLHKNVLKKKENKKKSSTESDIITKKNKKNKYFLLAHPELKEKIKNIDNLNFVVNKEVVKKKFLVPKSTKQEKSDRKNESNNSGSSKNKKNSLWIIEPCSSSSDDEDELNKKNKKKRKNLSEDEQHQTKKKKKNVIDKVDLSNFKFETSKQVMEDGTIVETFKAIEEKHDSDEEDNTIGNEKNTSSKIDKKENKKLKNVNDEKSLVSKEVKNKTKLNEMETKLQSSRFRYLNEFLYTKKSEESFEYFKRLDFLKIFKIKVKFISI